MIIKLLVEGGNMKPGSSVSQQLGPIGINLGKVISEVNSATKEFKGITLPVHLNVNPKTREFSIKVLSPPTSELIKKELNIEKASGERRKFIVGNLAIEQVISITKTKFNNLLAKDFLGALKSVIGTCMALGVIIESKDPKEILEEINEGKYIQEIKLQKTEVPIEKKKSLDEYFKAIQLRQEAVKKAEEEEAKAKEEKKTEADKEKPKEEKK